MSEAQITWGKYKDLPAPKPKELLGVWRIRMDAWWGSMFVNMKVITSETVRQWPVRGFPYEDKYMPEITFYKGHNIAFGFRRWGEFGIFNKGEFGIEEEGILHYNNGRIIDRLVRVAKDKMKGLFILDGKPKYIFTMERIDVVQTEEC